MKIFKLISRVIALCILFLGLMFYFGYGNPLPFSQSDYSLWENIALIAMPIVFIGLALGLKLPRIGGFLIVIPITIGFIVGILTDANLSINLFIPMIPGILYLIDGYSKR